MVLGSQKMRPVRDAVAAWLPQGHGWLELLGGGAILLALYILGQNNYLFFHGLTETFTIVISCALFVVFWNTRGLVDHGFFLVIGIACFFAAMLNLLHMLAHPRMALLSPGDGNISMQAKIACQWMASLSGCAAFLFVRRRVNQNRAMVFYSLLLAAILASIFVWHVFPDCVVAGRPTPFARLARLASCGAFLAMAMLLVVRRGMFEPKIFRLMLVAILAMAADELASVLSSNPEGFFKVAGHLIQVVALYLIYKAFIQVGLTQPLSLLFRGLKQGEEANRRLASIVQCTQDAIISEDLHGTILSWNPAAERIYGYRAEEIIGRSLDLLMRPDAPDEWRQNIAKLSRGERISQFETARRHKDGTTVDVSLTISPLRDMAGTIVGTSAIIRDISEDKRIAAELRKKEAELRQSQKLETVGSLAGGIAHEFNNLLQAIGGYATYALEGLAVEDQRAKDLEQVIKATQRATTLTRQLLGFSRRCVLQPTHIDANEALADVAKLVRPLIGAHMEVQTSFGADVGTIYADPGELQQVLLNLCLNARDAMPDGGKLLLKTESLILHDPAWDPHAPPAPGHYVVFNVTDTGCGMTEEVRQRIFEPFFTTKGVGKGTGLGLSMVYGVVQQHHGAIHVYSEVGCGTTFKIYLPRGEEAISEPSSRLSPPLPHGKETLLLAEDEPMIRSLILRSLEKGGYTVLTARDGQEALEVFQQHRDTIALVILDAIMPKLTGKEVYLRIKAASPATKVVFCTGYDPETAQSTFIVQERLRLIQKPFDTAGLLHTVREVLDAEGPPLSTAASILATASP